MNATSSARSVASPSRALSLTLPVPPSANRYWRIYRNRAVKSAEARAYQNRVGWLTRSAFEYRSMCPFPSESVKLTVRWYRGAKMGDLSNRIKVVEDALQGFAYVNDSQVVELHAYRFEDKANPRVEVTVEVFA